MGSKSGWLYTGSVWVLSRRVARPSSLKPPPPFAAGVAGTGAAPPTRAYFALFSLHAKKNHCLLQLMQTSQYFPLA